MRFLTIVKASPELLAANCHHSTSRGVRVKPSGGDIELRLPEAGLAQQMRTL